MIGVIADEVERVVVAEFFELFKTPWEFYRENRQYEILLTSKAGMPTPQTRLVIVFDSNPTALEIAHGAKALLLNQAGRALRYSSDQLPVYGSACSFENKTTSLLSDEESKECVAYFEKCNDFSKVRVGYDLFEEIRTLLTKGQPALQARVPTLDLHIAFLRDLIVKCGIQLVEIPPVPTGYKFIACLTHDVDHPSIRLHKFDHTTFGFLYRATFGSLHKLLRREVSVGELLTNWLAAAKLPLVYLGLADDFWRQFADRYRALEKEFRSTFFILPFKGRPGIGPTGSAPTFRASAYGADEISDIIRGLTARGHEVGLHGIDAWIDSTKGREELSVIRAQTGGSEIGVRMHWLYFDANSQKTLEEAGAKYDSTFGYNETVGYRAGTAQVYKPLQTSQLLELPLHIMDTALFYPSRMELTPKQASVVLDRMMDNAVRFGGVLTINWHDRSVAPERLWDGTYRQLLADLKSRGAWFATAGETVAWFQKRREEIFDNDKAVDRISESTLDVEINGTPRR